ncbi:hypothetical protein ABE521_01990 [Pseudomonas sp. TWI672]|uniref:hypothetical protein n=1 Tax=unclassified Pseudomonas TaxID=196821 RepID=UPI00320B57E6
MADQTQRLEIATVRAEVGSNIVYRFANDAIAAVPIPTESGDIQNLKQVILEIQEDAAEKISISTTIYPSVSAGLSGTTDQEIFLVQSDDANEIYTVWKNEGGTAANTGKTALSATAIQTALDASNEAAQAAEDAADTAIARTAGFLSPSAEPPVLRDNGLPLQEGDRYFNTEEQTEYLYKSTGWEANDSIVALEALTARITEEPMPGNIPEAGDDGLLSVNWMPNELVRAMQLSASDGAEGIGYVFGAENSTPTSVKFKIAERVSVVDFMSTAQKTDFFASAGLVDQTSAINAFWQFIKSTFVDVSSEDYVKRCGEIPSGLYRVDGSVNFTNLKARNTILLANGAVFHGRGATKNVVDMTGTRWLQTYGLTVFGDEASPPRSGLLLGPQNAETSGNNAFFGCNFTGHFVKTAVWNIGSETTSWVRTRAANYNTDPAAKVYIGDGKMRNGATSDYASLRAAGVGVSFTNNQFYSCDMRHLGGGAPMWLEFTRGWGFDRGCYFISFNDTIFELYQAADSVHQNLSIEGLMESTYTDTPTPGNTGCKHQVKFVGDGTDSTLEGFTFKVGIPHTALSSFKIDTSGAVKLTNADIVIGHQLTPDVPVFDAPGLSIVGRIQAARATELNLNQIARFDGQVVVAGTGYKLPAAGSYVLIASDSNQMVLGGTGPYLTDGVIKMMGANPDVAFKARGKGAGNAELGNDNLTNALTVVAGANAVNGVTVRGVATGNSPRIEAFGPGANISLLLNPKGTGQLQVPVANVPAYANDSSAATGGVPVGGFYRIGNALQIRIA